MPRDPRQKPSKITIKPGQRWRAANDSESAIVSGIGSVSQWGKPDLITVRFYVVGADPVLGPGVLEYTLEDFHRRFPVWVD